MSEKQAAEKACICPPIDGYRIKARGCLVHAEKDAAYWETRDQEENQAPVDPPHPHETAVRDYLNNAGITPETLRYAATHEALCRSWIFDLLTGLADTLDPATSPGLPPTPPQPADADETGAGR